MSKRCSTCGMHANENRVLKTKITKLEAEVARLRGLVIDLWVLDTDSLVEALEAGDEGEHSA